jgi:diguanylate cyclase (GGDEF)-like protein
VARELARCLRERVPISLMLIDLDHFKRINDSHGHQAGDAVLDRLAALLRSQARSSDVVCRYGGEEFVLLLPGMPQAAALARAEACRAAFARERIDYGTVQLAATLSVGVASCDDDAGDSPRQLLKRADEALYEAKGAGRNRVAAGGARRLAVD